MTEDSYKLACHEVLSAVGFKTEDAAQAIGALAALLREITKLGEGTGVLEVKGSAKEGRMVSWHSPEYWVRQKFHRRRA
jgi:hypothetical protein